MRSIPFALLLAVLAPTSSFAADKPFPRFEVQEIDTTLKVGYGLKIIDLNKDGKVDVVVADAARVIWFDNARGWKLHTIIDDAKAGVTTDNVCLDVYDIDGDGKLDVALGADWQPNNTKSGGSLQWLRQGKSIDEPWTVHPIAASIPTLHRIRFADVNDDNKPELLVSPLKGSTAEKDSPNPPLHLLAYSIPKDPADKWDEPRALGDALHVMHNFTFAEFGGKKLVWTASAEGVGALVQEGERWSWKHIGAGNQDDPKGARGSSEVKQGMSGKMPPYIVAIEPLHGHQVVMYQFRIVHEETDDQGNPLPRPPEKPEDRLAVRTLIDDQLKAGHALWCADLDGDGLDEIVAGFREPTAKGVGPGINVYRSSPDASPPLWQKHVLDDKGIACEDLACADLDGDGRIDVVACGRATGNVRIYWNKGAPKR
jgi:hypothetical protein